MAVDSASVFVNRDDYSLQSRAETDHRDVVHAYDRVPEVTSIQPYYAPFDLTMDRS